MSAFAKRVAKEILRDPLNLLFGLGFPVVLLLLLTVIQSNVPVELFAIGHLTPGITVFGLSFMTLFSATLIARDRESAFLQRLYTTPLTGLDFILGYMLPLLPIALGQTALCYLAAGLCPGVAIPFTACILTGLFTAMLWPGALIFMEENIPAAGVTAYALMAAGGDMGASLAPQLLGIVVDGVSATPLAAELGLRLGITAEQVGLKAGMLVTAVFPLLGAVILLFTVRFFKRTSE